MIDRDQLMKEVWEDEGVIVGRSLDMFVLEIAEKVAGGSTYKHPECTWQGYKLVIGQVAC